TRVAVCHRPGRGGGTAGGASVTLIALFEPRVAPVVVAVLLPKPRLVVVEELQPGHPLGALPEVEVGDEQPGRTTVLDRKGPPVVAPYDPRLAIGHVGQGQVGGVARVPNGQDVCRGRQRPGQGQQGVDRHAPEADTQLGPGGDAVNVALEGGRGKGVHLIPGPGLVLLDQPFDGEGPGVGRQPGCRLGGEDGPVAPDVVLAGREPGVPRAPVSATEASGEAHLAAPLEVEPGPARGSGTDG